ncbi:hypothetical protein JNO04_05250 [Halomonas sp. MC140]|nr:hypothetical protein [Halomonas sp. MC140]MDN7131761.1 hypothetical protein [Halomonas sp. MC140]
MNLLKAVASVGLIAFSAMAYSNDSERGLDFGFTPDEYADRFNGHMTQFGMPFSLDASISDEEVDDQAVFGSVFLDTVSILGTADPDSKLVNHLVMNGTGDGTEESGEFIIVMFSIAIASLDPGEMTDEPLVMLLGLVDDMKSSPDSTASIVVEGISFSASNSPYTGVMLTVSPAE